MFPYFVPRPYSQALTRVCFPARESARRSKLRKKQEAGELQQKIDVLGDEHAALEAQVRVSCSGYPQGAFAQSLP